MSRKNNLRQFPSIVNGDMSLASITSAVTNIQFLDNISIQLNFSGSPTGTFAIQVSVDYVQDDNGNVVTPGNWVAISLPSTPVASGSPGSIVIDLNQLATPWIRVVYTKSSGTGTLNSFISGKML